MKAILKFEDQKIELSSIIQELDVPCPWDDKGKTTHNKFRIDVRTNLDNESFDFYGSHEDWKNKKTRMNREETIYAFYCFLQDGLSSDQSFEGFCNDFGYDEDSRKAEQIFKECEEALSKAKSLFSVDLYDLVNHIQEKYDL